MVAVVGKDAKTIDLLIWHLRQSGIDGYGFQDVSTTRLLAIAVTAVVLFVDDFPHHAVDEAVSRIRRMQPHILMVLVYETYVPFPPVPNSVVVPRDKWRSGILDALRAFLERQHN